tara:strand:+ start:684 stop:1778 length:1095 start_codon:yes stop_codon:yes gene_type:complete
MQEDPWSKFASFDEALWREQAKDVDLYALKIGDVKLPIRGERRGLWPPFPAKALQVDSLANAWEIQQRHDSNAALLQALQHGVEGIRVASADSFGELLAGVHLNMVSLHVVGPSSESQIQVLKSLGANAELRGSWLNASSGGSDDAKVQLDHLNLIQAVFPLLRSWTCPSVQWLNQGDTCYHVMARIGWTLDQFMKSFHSVERKSQAVLQVALEWSVGENILLEIASLRALRLFWEQWLEFHQLPTVSVWINAVNAPYAMDTAKKEDHLIPQTAGVYAAVMGGADGIEAVPHDAAGEVGLSSPDGLRWARNVHHIFREESGLHRVTDPMGGSAVVESWTHTLLERAWEEYRSGYVQDARIKTEH